MSTIGEDFQLGTCSKKDLEANLKEHLAGVHHVPALIFHNQDKSMEES